MRILFTSRGSAGHLLPLTPFAHAAQRAGHEVLVTSQRQNEGNVARTGLPYALVEDPAPEAFGSLQAQFVALGIDAANDRMLAEYFARFDTEAMLPGLRALGGTWRPDLIVREAWEYGSALVGELHDIPVVRVGLGLAALEERSIALAAPAVDDLRASLGLPADPDGDRMRETPLYTMMPAGLEERGGERAAVQRYRAAEPVLTVRDSAPLPDWWAGSDDPLVYFSLGSIAGKPHMTYFPALYRLAIDVLASLPVRLLVTLGDAPDPAALGDLPANVHVERWIPQEAVLPHASVAVSHGGYGSTLGALAHGVPMVLLPLFSIDQWANADAVQRAGAGLALVDDRDSRLVLELPDVLTLAGLAPAVSEVLTHDAYRRRARVIAAEMAALAPVEDAVEALAAIPAAPRPWRGAAAW